MKYRELGKTGKKVSVLGFGIMRPPYTEVEPTGIDLNKYYEMIEYAYSKGVNYFDTAQNYCEGRSENILGEAVKGFRDKVYIATKVGVWHLKSGQNDLEEHLKSQLERLKTDYIDFYLIHALTDSRWSKFDEAGIIDFFESKKRQGTIRHYGFSYHGTPFFFKKIADRYDWDFAQLQVNYVDRNLQAGEEGLIHADRTGLGTIIMEPLRGGHLVNELPGRIKELLEKYSPGRSLANWALSWLWNRRDVDLVLSGMSSMEQVAENISIASDAEPGMMTPDELGILEEARRVYLEYVKIPCTMCRYCLPCPVKTEIPWIFEAYNNAFVVSSQSGKSYYEHLTKDREPCMECGRCNSQCPQAIDIMSALKEVKEYFSKI